MTLDQLEAFVAVTRAGTITAAAASLHKSQPAVSKLVSNLEAELGVVLLDRSGYRPALTDEGRAFQARAAAVVDDAQALRSLGEGLSRRPERRVRLMLDAITPLPPVLEVLARVRRQFPAVRIELDVGRWTGTAHRMLEGEADLAIACGPLPDSTRLVARSFLDVRIVAVAHRDHPLVAVPGPVPPELLRAHPQVILADPTGPDSTTSLNVLPEGLAWRVTDLSAKRQIIDAGLGWGGLPHHLVDADLASGRLRALEVEAFETHTMALHLLRRRSRARKVVATTLWQELSRLGR